MWKDILEEIGPNGNIQAIVKQEKDVCYFYLFGSPKINFGTRSVWVCNLTPSAETLDVSRMRDGLPPQNPAPHCRHPKRRPAPRAEDLEVVWLPEGNGAALYEKGEIIAIIPPWSGHQGFHGYARDNIGEGPLAWELNDENDLHRRFDEARAYWRTWESDETWSAIQDALISTYENTLGPHDKYYAIDGKKWPPRAMLRIPVAGGFAFVTIGLSSRPQPNVESISDEPAALRRMELGVIVPDAWTDEALNRIGAYLSAQSNLPWTHYTWLGHGHTLPCDSWHNPQFSIALFSSRHPAAPELDLGRSFGDPINLLWLLPVDEAERQRAMDEGSATLLKHLPDTRWKDA